MSRNTSDSDRVIELLPPKRRVFVREYLVDMSPGKAAVRAGYSRQNGYLMLKDDLVQLAIEDEQERRQQELKVSADRVVQELAVIGFSDIHDFVRVNTDGSVSVRTTNELDIDKRRAISEISEIDSPTSHRITFKLHSKVDALKLLCKHLGIAIDRLILQGDAQGGPVQVQQTPLPPQPTTIAEWQEQVAEAERLRQERLNAPDSAVAEDIEEDPDYE